jgi:hypothetical protein
MRERIINQSLRIALTGLGTINDALCQNASIRPVHLRLGATRLLDRFSRRFERRRE